MGAMRSSGNVIYYLLSDQLNSTSRIVNSAGVIQATQYYYPFGGNRGAAFSTLTTKRFTGQYHEKDIPGGEGLSYYNARWYDAKLGRFISADTIVPSPGNPQTLNRYSYVVNNPLKYIDPSGHCFVAPPFDTLVCVALLALVLAGDSAPSTPPPPRNYPENLSGEKQCHSTLPGCFGSTVDLKDFADYGEGNPIPLAEFEEFANEVAEDLYTHDLTWPGLLSGRDKYDTPFYNGGQSRIRERDPEIAKGVFPADQQVCIETLGCSGRSEINYIAQGMWGAATGEPRNVSKIIAWTWKRAEYGEKPTAGTYFWLQYGRDYYRDWLKDQE